MANQKNPESHSITVSEAGDMKNVAYAYQKEGTDIPNIVVNKNYNDLSKDNKATFDKFMSMVKSLR